MTNDINVNVDSVLKNHKPIIIVYYPYIYQSDKEHIRKLKIKFENIFGEMYFVFFMSTTEEIFRMEILSVLKSKFIKDSDLKSYLDNVNEEHLQQFDKYITKISSKLDKNKR